MTSSDTEPASPIRGIGSDIIEISRIRLTLQNHGKHFYQKLFTKSEQKYCLSHRDPAPYFAARFAAKEAIAKCLGTGFGKHLSWLDIEIVKDPSGKPSVQLSPSAMAAFKNPHIHLSLSHCKEYALAMAIHT